MLKSCRSSIHFTSLVSPNRRLYSTSKTIKEHDAILIRQHGPKFSRYRLTKPIRHSTDVKLAFGASVPGSDLIGRKYLDDTVDNQGNKLTLHELSLANYIANTARDATPIYAHDANTIVSLLDIHPSRPGEDAEEDDGPDDAAAVSRTHLPLEVFEAGTGMGSLTLHLARALHAANPAVPPRLRQTLLTTPLKPLSEPLSNHRYLDFDRADSTDGPISATELYDTYLQSRRAVIHTIDHSKKHSHAAYKLIRNFRRAQYLPSIDFHIGSIGDFLTRELARRSHRPFLSHAILDLPAAHEHAHSVVSALRDNGILVIFKPSISQIGEFDLWVRNAGQPLRQEKVLELPNASFSEKGFDLTGGGGGRTWDVKMTTPKKKKKKRVADIGAEGLEQTGTEELEGDTAPGDAVQVMRPKVGGQIVGGGFVAVYRRYPGEARAVAKDPFTEKSGHSQSEKVSPSTSWLQRLLKVFR